MGVHALGIIGILIIIMALINVGFRMTDEGKSDYKTRSLKDRCVKCCEPSGMLEIERAECKRMCAQLSHDGGDESLIEYINKSKEELE